MDKDSRSPHQPSSGSGRGTRSRRARSVSTPSTAPSIASSMSSSVRRLSSVCAYTLNRAADTHPRLLLRAMQDWTLDGIHNLLPHHQAGHKIMKKWLVLFKQYRRPIRFWHSLWPIISKASLRTSTGFHRLRHHSYLPSCRGSRINRLHLTVWPCPSKLPTLGCCIRRTAVIHRLAILFQNKHC
jgi:hypothetical protein